MLDMQFKEFSRLDISPGVTTEIERHLQPFALDCRGDKRRY